MTYRKDFQHVKKVLNHDFYNCIQMYDYEYFMYVFCICAGECLILV